ncbi:T9SS type A sorting domain-containing protein [Psychroserpens mesophilus]|uniref:T9SS type A sorting domain-containing protein n=1 Tax=Psychroserpens mesophilus TaxID=325473 RepID=UPI003D653B29
MKKITLSLCLVLLSSVFLTLNAQVLNQNANWPSVDWILTGTYTDSPAPDLSVEADPTVDANFAFDDDDSGNGSDDSIAAESPEIDLTAAFDAGETWLTVSLDYVYRKLSVEEFLRIQYFDGETLTWVNWEPDSMPGNDTALTDDFCSGTPVAYTSAVLNISGFSVLQQSNFRYRFVYDDDPNGPAWEYGFCLNSPTITSATPPSCPDPTSLSATTLNTTDVDLEWVEIGSATSWNIEIVDVTAGGTQTMIPTYSGVTNPYTETMLLPGNDYEFYVQSDCGGSGTSNWVGPFAWSQPVAGSVCESAIVIGALPYTITDDTGNYGDDYDLAPGTDCGTLNNYLNGDDVVYEYTATSDTSINVSLTGIGSTYTGVFAYNDCADIGVMCATEGDFYDFNDGIADLEFDLTVTNGETYYFVISTWATPQTTAYTLNITENSCTDATVAYSVVDDCANSGGFNILVDITDLGSSTSIDINDDQGSATQSTAVADMFTFGPYVNGTDVIISITDNDDPNCNQASNALTQNVCPVSNDDCADAIDLDPFANADGTCTVLYSGSNVGATNSAGEIAPSGTCADGDAAPADVWFTLTVPASGQFDFEFITNPGFSTLVELYTGTCGSLTALDPVLCTNGATRTFTGLTPGETVYLRVWDYGSDDEGVLEVCINYLNCAPATVTYSVIDDCANSGGFNILVDITDVGSSTSIDINDDQGSATQSTGVAGMFTFGPYTNGTDVIISLTDNDDGNCSQASGTLTQAACPPDNNACAGAIVINDGDSVTGSTIAATNVEALTACAGGGGSAVTGCAGGTGTLNFGAGIWYVYTAGPDEAITVTTDNSIAPFFDTEIQVFSGDCNNLVCVGGDDDGGVNGALSTFCWESSAADGTTVDYYIYVDGHAANSGDFTLDLSVESTLSTTDFESQNAFSYFPNPVKNELTLKAQNNIQNISVLNMLGQEVLRTSPNTLESKLDMNALSQGSYFVQVTINNVTEIVRIIKD